MAKDAIEELQEEGFLIERITQAVKGAFGPIVKEMEDASEVDQMEEDLQEVEEIIQNSEENEPPINAFSVQEVEKKSVRVCVWGGGEGGGGGGGGRGGGG